MPKTNKQTKKTMRRGRALVRGADPLGLTPMPKKFDTSVMVTHRFRYSANGALALTPVTGLDLLGAIGVATSATGITNALAAVRIKSVEAWCPATSGAISLDVIFLGSSYVAPHRTSDVSMGYTVPSHVKCVPTPGSEPSLWISYNNRNATYFTINGPSATTVDVVLDIIYMNGGVLSNGNVITYVTSGVTAGLIYFGPLDKNTGSPKLIPSDVAYYG